MKDITPKGQGHNDKIFVKKNKVYKTDTKPKITIRNTLDNIDFNANVTPSNNTANKHKKYLLDKAKNTIKQTTIDNNHISNIRYIKDNGYLTNEYNAPATSKQYMSDNEYSGNPKTQNEGYGYITNKKFAPATNKHDLSNNEYIGSMNSSDKKHIDYNSMYNAQLNSSKEQISRGRNPTQNNVKICNGQDTLNVAHKKQISGINYNRIEKQKVYDKIIDNKKIITTNIKNQYSNKINDDLINPDNLKPFKKNPYTQSLQSFGVAL